MSGKLQFREKLSGILELGNERGKVLSTEDVEKYFEEDRLSKEQMELVYDYLLSQRIAVNGYVKKGGTISGIEDGEEQELILPEADRQYLEDYQEELALLRPINEKEKQLQCYFPRVIEIAKELYTTEFFIGDLIQEGNVGLMMALETESEEVKILDAVRQSILMLMEEQNELKRQDEKMVEKVAFLDESLKNLTEDLNRKPTLEELAAYMEMTEEEVNDVLRLTGEDDDEEEEE